MKNYITTKTYNTLNLTVLPILLIYSLSITLTPIVSGITNAKFNSLSLAQKNNFQLLAGKAEGKNTTTAINTATYISNGQILARQIDNSNLQSYITDAKGSVLKLNDSNGLNTQNYSYAAYGDVINIATPQKVQQRNALINNDNTIIPNSLQYNGERFDNNTKLQYLRARFYNPETKRFVTQDTYSLLNRFGYVNGNPVTYSDPAGHDVWSDIGNGISNAWNSVSNGISSAWNSSDGAKAGLGIAGGLLGLGLIGLTGLAGYGICRKIKSFRKPPPIEGKGVINTEENMPVVSLNENNSTASITSGNSTSSSSENLVKTIATLEAQTKKELTKHIADLTVDDVTKNIIDSEVIHSKETKKKIEEIPNELFYPDDKLCDKFMFEKDGVRLKYIRTFLKRKNSLSDKITTYMRAITGSTKIYAILVYNANQLTEMMEKNSALTKEAQASIKGLREYTESCEFLEIAYQQIVTLNLL